MRVCPALFRYLIPEKNAHDHFYLGPVLVLRQRPSAFLHQTFYDPICSELRDPIRHDDSSPEFRFGISELKWTGIGEFNSDDHQVYYCGQESLRRNGGAFIVIKRVGKAVLGYNLQNDRMISVRIQGKPVNIMEVQVYAPTTGADEAEVDQLKLKKVGKSTRPLRYDLNYIPDEYTVEVTNRFKELDLIDRVPVELWTDVRNIAEECKEIEENNRIGRTRDLFKKMGDTKGTFHAKMDMKKDQNGRDLTEAEEIKKRWQDYTEELYQKEQHIMRKVDLDESPVGIKIAGRNINNLTYADDTTLMAESEEELKSLLMQVKEESAKVGLKLNIKKTKIMASSPLTSWQIDGEEMEKDLLMLLKSEIASDQAASVRLDPNLYVESLISLVRLLRSETLIPWNHPHCPIEQDSEWKVKQNRQDLPQLITAS
ncbi:Craniofacial development protein 2 [Varanus komodoensis]|nr:Craniofacial development protein 2 [Varanus komodoensis]